MGGKFVGALVVIPIFVKLRNDIAGCRSGPCAAGRKKTGVLNSHRLGSLHKLLKRTM
jgi:uncharacterized protein (UPF0264 family)